MPSSSVVGTAATPAPVEVEVDRIPELPGESERLRAVLSPCNNRLDPAGDRLAVAGRRREVVSDRYIGEQTERLATTQGRLFTSASPAGSLTVPPRRPMPRTVLGNLIKPESLILRATSLGSAPMAERTRRRKARSAGSRKATKRARPKGRAARGKAPKPKKKTLRKPKAAATRTRPSPRRPAKATAQAATPEAQAPAGEHPEATAQRTETVLGPGEPGQTPASDADDT